MTDPVKAKIRINPYLLPVWLEDLQPLIDAILDLIPPTPPEQLMQPIPDDTVLGNISGGMALPSALTGSQLKGLLEAVNESWHLPQNLTLDGYLYTAATYGIRSGWSSPYGHQISSFGYALDMAGYGGGFPMARFNIGAGDVNLNLIRTGSALRLSADSGQSVVWGQGGNPLFLTSTSYSGMTVYSDSVRATSVTLGTDGVRWPALYTSALVADACFETLEGRFIPVSGGTIDIYHRFGVVDPAANLAALTINLKGGSMPSIGEQFSIIATKDITALTVAGAVTVIGAPTAMTAGQSFTVRYSSTLNKYCCIAKA